MDLFFFSETMKKGPKKSLKRKYSVKPPSAMAQGLRVKRQVLTPKKSQKTAFASFLDLLRLLVQNDHQERHLWKVV